MLGSENERPAPFPTLYSVFLEDIIEAIGYIREYTAEYSFEDFTKDRKLLGS